MKEASSEIGKAWSGDEGKESNGLSKNLRRREKMSHPRKQRMRQIITSEDVNDRVVGGG